MPAGARYVRCAFVSAMFAVTLAASAQPALPVVAAPAGLPRLHDVSVADYRAHLDSLRQLVADCGRVITACDAAKVGEDDNVVAPNGGRTAQRYGWLRNLIEDKNDPSHAQRNEMLPRAAQRLSEQAEEVHQPNTAAGPLQVQRSTRDKVLQGQGISDGDTRLLPLRTHRRVDIREAGETILWRGKSWPHGHRGLASCCSGDRWSWH